MGEPTQRVIEGAETDFLERIERKAKAHLCGCLQCAKCSSGCPVAARADLKPHVLVRLIQLGQRDEVLGSKMIWECMTCHTCATRCPQKVDIAALVDVLRQESRAGQKVHGETSVPAFNDLFLGTVRRLGRIHEMSLMALYKLRTLDLFTDAKKMPMMLRKGKLPLLPKRVSAAKARKELFDRARATGEDGQ